MGPENKTTKTITDDFGFVYGSQEVEVVFLKTMCEASIKYDTTPLNLRRG